MKSPAGSAQELWSHAGHHGSARPAGDFTSSAGSCTGQPGGDDESLAGGTGPPAAKFSPMADHRPTVAADVADAIVAYRSAGQKPVEIAMALHVTIGEVRSVLRDAERPPGTPHHSGLLRPH